MAQTTGFRTVPQGKLSARLKEAKAESYGDCVDQRCQIELGKALEAKKTRITKLIRV